MSADGSGKCQGGAVVAVALGAIVIAASQPWATATACSDPVRARSLLARMSAADPAIFAHDMKDRRKIDFRLAAPADCVDGKVDIFDCANIELLGHLAVADIGGGSGNDSWGWKDSQTGRYYALVGRTNGTAFVDVTDPATPRYVGNLPTRNGINIWRDIKTYGNYALVVADHVTGHGMQVFDLTRLRRTAVTPQTYSADVVYDGFNRAHNIVVNEDSGFAYATGSDTCNGGPHMIDIRQPLQPHAAGCYGADGYTHDAQCVIYRGPDQDYQGREVCFASNEDSLTLLDVTDKTNPTMISRNTYQGMAYAHQGWLTEDQRYFLLDDEFDERQTRSNTKTYVWDMSDLDRPRVTGFHTGSGFSADHNQYIVGRYSYQANYTRGLRVLELIDPASAGLREVAYIDTFPEQDGLAFSGAWSVYPFFDNGVVIFSDANRGVFIVRPRLGDPQNPPNPDHELFDDGFENAAAGR